MQITPSALTEFFAENGPFKTKSGILIRMVDNIFCLEVKLKEDEETDHLFELYDEVHGAEQFMAVYEIHSLADLHLLNTSHVWIRY